MKVKPLADRVLVKNDKAETKTSGGIIIPEAAQEKTQTASVIAVGPGTEDEKITVKPGDRIMYDKYAGTQIKIDGEDHLILKMNDIIDSLFDQLVQKSNDHEDTQIATLNEIESIWGNLTYETRNLYSKIIGSTISRMDESKVIASKKVKSTQFETGFDSPYIENIISNNYL